MLAKKGLLKTDFDYADLYIGYQTALSRDTVDAYHDGWGYGPGWGGGLASLSEASIHARQLTWTCMRRKEKKLGVAACAVSNAGRDQTKSRQK